MRPGLRAPGRGRAFRRAAGSPSRSRRGRPAPTGRELAGEVRPASTRQAATCGGAVPARIDGARALRRPARKASDGPMRRGARPGEAEAAVGLRRGRGGGRRTAAGLRGPNSEKSGTCPQPTNQSPLASACRLPWLSATSGGRVGELADERRPCPFCAVEPQHDAARLAVDGRRGAVVEDADRAVGQLARVVLPGGRVAAGSAKLLVLAAQAPERPARCAPSDVVDRPGVARRDEQRPVGVEVDRVDVEEVERPSASELPRGRS